MLISAILLAACSPQPSPAQTLETIPYVGGVTDVGAIVMVWLAQPGSAAIEYASDPGFSGALRTTTSESLPAEDNVIKIAISGLSPSTRYYYRVVNSSGVTISRIQSFTTFAPTGTDAPLTIFFGSCNQSRTTDTGGTFNVAADLGGDLFIHLGDWAYPDIRIPNYAHTDESMRETYRLRLDTAYPFARRVLASMSMAYEWDDHDAFGSNSDGTTPDSLKNRVLAAYRRWVPHYPLASSQGIWHSFHAGNVDIFMLDNRTFRSPIDRAFNGNKFQPPPGHSMLAGSEFDISGEDQRTWLMKALRTSTARWKIIASPLPFNPAMGQMISLADLIGRPDIAKRFAEETWSGYPGDIDSIRALIGEGNLRNTVFISGSVHTNMYDNGEHSLLPEFVAANLDVENSGLYDSLRSYGLNLWTAGQSGSASTIGRLRVETTPKHRLVIESFSESGDKLLEMVVDEQASGDVPMVRATGWGVSSVSITDSRLRIQLSGESHGTATVRIVSVDGRELLRRSLRYNTGPTLDVAVPALPAGTYVGSVEIDGEQATFRMEITGR